MSGQARIVLQSHDASYLSVPGDKIGSAIDLIESSMLMKFPILSLAYTVSMPVEIKVR
jgi:hypothetical protein